MRIFTRQLVALTLAAGLACAAAQAAAPAANKTTQPSDKGSIASQERLLQKLRSLNQDSLTASLDHNRKEWESLSPDQREKFRREALAFAQKSPQEQDQLLKKYEQLIKMTAQERSTYMNRQAWLKVVVESLSAKQRKDLQAMAPNERAKMLLERKAELIADGKLTADGKPATQPANTPVTQPARG